MAGFNSPMFNAAGCGVVFGRRGDTGIKSRHHKRLFMSQRRLWKKVDNKENLAREKK